jgi:hypothetical protein
MANQKLTPGVVLNYMRDNQNNNKSLKAVFTNQFFTRMDIKELEGMKKAIDKEMGRRAKQVIDEKIEFLKQHGYKVQKD